MNKKELLEYLKSLSTTNNKRDGIDIKKEEAQLIIETINNYKKILDKIKKELEEPDIYGVDEDGYDDAYYDKIYVRRIEELLEEIDE